MRSLMMTFCWQRWFFVVLMAAIPTADRPTPAFAQPPPTLAAPNRAGKDFYGEPQPAGALARFGTVRWRPGRNSRFVAFAVEGKLAVAREPDGVVQIYDVARGNSVHRLGSPQGKANDSSLPLSTSVLSPGGRFLALLGGTDRTLHVWEIASLDFHGTELCNILGIGPQGNTASF